MPMMAEPDVTTLLELAKEGDREARERLFHLVEGELRRLAHARLRGRPPNPGVETTMLVDDAFLKLTGDREQHWESRAHFFCLAAQVIRQLVVDEARRRAAKKRGGGEPHVPLDRLTDPVAWRSVDPLMLLALNEALSSLSASH